jgi:predicted double-glycine peptidase
VKVDNTKTLTQKDHFSCGAIALYNAIVLLGVKPPSLKKLKIMCKTTNSKSPLGLGTNLTDMRFAAQQLGFSFKKVVRNNVSDIIIFNYLTKQNSLHLVASKDGIMYNYWNGNKYTIRSNNKAKPIKCYKLQKKGL